MTRGRTLIALVVLVLVGGAAFAALQLALAQPSISRSGSEYASSVGERPWRKVLDGEGHRAHLTGVRPVACAECHAIQNGTFTKPDASRCTRCHADVQATVHESPTAPPETKECTTCHSFLATDAQKGPWDCIRCHDKAQSGFGAVAVHAKEACGGCHRPHQRPQLAAAECTSCHTKVAAKHGDHAPGPSLCLDCHQPHEQAGTADGKCVDCHQNHLKTTPQIAMTALQPGKHDRCTGCHRGHDFTAGGVAACKTCHDDQVTLGALTAKPHADCKSCHDSHNPTADASNRCQGCHSTLHPSHPAAGGTCTGCHQIHTKTPQANAAVACATCHTKASGDNAFHDGTTACTSCHKPHTFAKPSVPTVCADCHKQEKTLTAGGGHQTCTGCHTPHDPKAAPKACATCHADQGKLVATNQGHQTCTGCHAQPHAPKQDMPACKTCHANEASSAPGDHQTCANCHEPHGGTQSGSTKCATCHADKAGGNHKTVKGGCLTCHAPHAGTGSPAKPPTCTSCHSDRSKLPGLHQKQGHEDCANCHTSHGAPRGDRASCTTCHKDRADHEPQSKTCNGCHVFKGSK